MLGYGEKLNNSISEEIKFELFEKTWDILAENGNVSQKQQSKEYYIKKICIYVYCI